MRVCVCVCLCVPIHRHTSLSTSHQTKDRLVLRAIHKCYEHNTFPTPQGRPLAYMCVCVCMRCDAVRCAGTSIVVALLTTYPVPFCSLWRRETHRDLSWQREINFDSLLIYFFTYIMSRQSHPFLPLSLSIWQNFFTCRSHDRQQHSLLPSSSHT